MNDPSAPPPPSRGFGDDSEDGCRVIRADPAGVVPVVIVTVTVAGDREASEGIPLGVLRHAAQDVVVFVGAAVGVFAPVAEKALTEQVRAQLDIDGADLVLFLEHVDAQDPEFRVARGVGVVEAAVAKVHPETPVLVELVAAAAIPPAGPEQIGAAGGVGGRRLAAALREHHDGGDNGRREEEDLAVLLLRGADDGIAGLQERQRGLGVERHGTGALVRW